MIAARFLALCLPIVSILAGCSSTGPASNDIAQESAESNELIESAKARIEASARDNSMLGRPLPPLPGVNIPAPETSNTSDPEHHPPEQ
jgi:hypothetical protein